jgi:hypothetical protein
MVHETGQTRIPHLPEEIGLEIGLGRDPVVHPLLQGLDRHDVRGGGELIPAEESVVGVRDHRPELPGVVRNGRCPRVDPPWVISSTALP